MEYKGFKIKVYRDTECGYYCRVTRIKDDWLLDDWYNVSAKSNEDVIKNGRELVDDYYTNPSDYED